MMRNDVVALKVTVNGTPHVLTTDPDRPLLDLLREDLQLTGAKYGCGEGQCGACSVLMDGRRVFSCTTPAARAEGKAIRTIEGLAVGDELHPVQRAFLEEGAFQCGYCTPGMILTTVALLEANPDPSDEEIRGSLNRNLCRCCSYSSILQAVRRASRREGR